VYLYVLFCFVYLCVCFVYFDITNLCRCWAIIGILDRSLLYFEQMVDVIIHNFDTLYPSVVAVAGRYPQREINSLLLNGVIISTKERIIGCNVEVFRH